MTIKEFFKQYKKPILYWFIFGAAVLIAGGVIWWIKPVKIIESNLCGPEPPAACAAGTRLTCENGEWGCKI